MVWNGISSVVSVNKDATAIRDSCPLRPHPLPLMNFWATMVSSRQVVPFPTQRIQECHSPSTDGQAQVISLWCKQRHFSLRVRRRRDRVPWGRLLYMPIVTPMQETWVWTLGWEDLLEEGVATHSSILAGEPMDRSAWWATGHGVTKSDTTEWLNTQQ